MNKYCKNCSNYYQHYVLGGRGIFRAYCGHCGLYRPKNRRPDSIACEKFVPTQPDEDAFVSKEYLSKALLDYILKMELLPPIKDITEK